MADSTKQYGTRKRVHIYVDPWMWPALNERAEQEDGESRSSLIRRYVEDGLRRDGIDVEAFKREKGDDNR